MNKLWQDSAWEDYLYRQTRDRKTLKRINQLLQDISRNGYNCIGKPEPLKGDLTGWWSCRIDDTIGWYTALTTELLKSLNAAALEKGMNFSQVLQDALREKLNVG